MMLFVAQLMIKNNLRLVTNSPSTTEVVFSIGIMLTSRSSSRFKRKLIVLPLGQTDYSRRAVINNLWHLETEHRIVNASQNAVFEARHLLTSGNNDVNIIIPLNRYSFFEELEDRTLPTMKLQFQIQLLDDANSICKLSAVDNARFVID